MEQSIKTQILTINKQSPEISILNSASQLINKGHLVAFPTETVYGLGADVFNTKAIQSIFDVKERPATDPLIVHIENINALKTVAINVPELAYELANRFWPGPLTLILEKHPKIPLAVTAAGSSVAVRIPNHQTALMLIKLSDCPIAAPSANRFSKPSPTLATHVWNDLNGKIAMILDSGPTDIGLESTVLNLTESPPCVLRPGGVSFETLQSIVPNIQMRKSYLRKDRKVQISPGQLFKHYSPNAPLILFRGQSAKDTIHAMYIHMEKLLKNKQRVGAMLVEEDIACFQELIHMGGILENLGSINRLDCVAKNLFACMRNLDSAHVDVILISTPPDYDLGLAINDRLIRAAADVVWA
jgi:L-threonylcarbamoyladenylate synthase